MEFPSLGRQCADTECSQLDFLPFTCHYCKKIYCQDHWKLEHHKCSNKDAAAQLDQRVPTCPLCNKAVPVRKGEDPNVRMEQHIAAGCPEPATTVSKPIYTNSCNFKTCKNRSAIPIICQNCKLNYCLKHRLESDHACSAAPSKNGTNNNGKKPQQQQQQQQQDNRTFASKAANAAKNARTGLHLPHGHGHGSSSGNNNSNSNNNNRPPPSSGKGNGKDKCVVS